MYHKNNRNNQHENFLKEVKGFYLPLFEAFSDFILTPKPYKLHQYKGANLERFEIVLENCLSPFLLGTKYSDLPRLTDVEQIIQKHLNGTSLVNFEELKNDLLYVKNWVEKAYLHIESYLKSLPLENKIYGNFLKYFRILIGLVVSFFEKGKVEIKEDYSGYNFFYRYDCNFNFCLQEDLINLYIDIKKEKNDKRLNSLGNLLKKGISSEKNADAFFNQISTIGSSLPLSYPIFKYKISRLCDAWNNLRTKSLLKTEAVNLATSEWVKLGQEIYKKLNIYDSSQNLLIKEQDIQNKPPFINIENKFISKFEKNIAQAKNKFFNSFFKNEKYYGKEPSLLSAHAQVSNFFKKYKSSLEKIKNKQNNFKIKESIEISIVFIKKLIFNPSLQNFLIEKIEIFLEVFLKKVTPFEDLEEEKNIFSTVKESSLKKQAIIIVPLSLTKTYDQKKVLLDEFVEYFNRFLFICNELILSGPVFYFSTQDSFKDFPWVDRVVVSYLREKSKKINKTIKDRDFLFVHQCLMDWFAVIIKIYEFYREEEKLTLSHVDQQYFKFIKFFYQNLNDLFLEYSKIIRNEEITPKESNRIFYQEYIEFKKEELSLDLKLTREKILKKAKKIDNHIFSLTFEPILKGLLCPENDEDLNSKFDLCMDEKDQFSDASLRYLLESWRLLVLSIRKVIIKFLYKEKPAQIELPDYFFIENVFFTITTDLTGLANYRNTTAALWKEGRITQEEVAYYEEAAYYTGSEPDAWYDKKIDIEEAFHIMFKSINQLNNHPPIQKLILSEIINLSSKLKDALNNQTFENETANSSVYYSQHIYHPSSLWFGSSPRPDYLLPHFLDHTKNYMIG